MFRPMLWIICLIVCHTTPSQAGAESQNEFWERFDEKKLPLNLWTFDPRNPAGSLHAVDGKCWKMSIPGGTSDRSPASLTSRCKLLGDFRVEMDFQWLKVPTVKSGNFQISIFVSGPDGHAAVMRALYHELGHGWSIWHEPTDKARQGHWENLTTNSMEGTLRLRRVASKLYFEAVSADSKKLIPLGNLEFGKQEIGQLEFRVMVPETRGIAQVCIDNIHVRADQIIYPPQPAPSMVGQRVWIAAVVMCLLLIVGGGLTLAHHGIRS